MTPQSSPAVPVSSDGGKLTASDGSKSIDNKQAGGGNESQHNGDQGYTAMDSKVPATDTRPLEDWYTLGVPPHLSFDSMSLGKSESAQYTKELVQVDWRSSDPIDLWVIKPVGVKNPPVILYLYSFPSTNNRYNDPEFCKFLTRHGFAAVGFLSALTGDRFHSRPMKQWFVSELPESLGSSVHDVQLILNYLDSRGDLDMTRVGMFGDGSGASIAIMAAAVDSRIKVLDLLDPWGDWPEWLAKSTLVPEDERAAYLKPEFLKNLENLDPVKWLPELKTQRVRLQYIEDLKVTPKAVRERVAAAAPPSVKVVHYESTKAFLDNVASSGKGFEWIQEQVGLASSVEANQAGSRPNPNSNVMNSH
jgi:hypothetical protein